MSGYVIARGDGLAVLEGSRACAVRWGKDPEQVRVYEHIGLAEASLLLMRFQEKAVAADKAAREAELAAQQAAE